MASSSKNPKEEEGFEVQFLSNEVKQLDFRPILEVSYKNHPTSTLSIILPKVMMVQDVRKCYNCRVGEIGDMEMHQAYDKLCENGVLKEEFQIVERKCLTHALVFPTFFKTEWIRIFLNRIYDGYLWLEVGPIRIRKRIMHRVIGFPTLDWYKIL